MEGFTEFEQRGAYFGGDPVIASKKGVNISSAAARSTSWPSSRGIMAIGDGSIKTLLLRGIKDSPPYLHDGRLLTLMTRWSSSI